MVEAGRASRRRPSKIGPSQLAPPLQSRDRSLARRIRHGRVHQASGFYLCGRQAAMVIRGLTTKRFRIEPTLSWVLQQTIFHAIVGIARVEHGAVKPLSIVGE